MKRQVTEEVEISTTHMTSEEFNLEDIRIPTTPKGKDRARNLNGHVTKMAIKYMKRNSNQ